MCIGQADIATNSQTSPMLDVSRHLKITSMKQVLLFFFLLYQTNVIGQVLRQELKTVKTEEQAEEFITKHPKLKGEIINIDSGVDSLELHQTLYTKRIGDVLEFKNNTYKVLHDTTTYLFRVNYIYFDGSSLTKKEIDSLRNLVMKEYGRGVSFDTLAAKFNMDGNQKYGDTDWFRPDQMVKEFSDEVIKHKTSEIFFVDVTSNSWFYVVKKTFEPKKIKKLVLLSLSSGG